MKTYVIGDIHGGAKALEQVLERCGFDNKKDRLIPVGDICDGWSETPECVDILLDINNLISIRGNHDVWCHDWFDRGLTPIIWTQQGGQATIDAYVRTGKITDLSHKDFWENQIDYFIDEDNRLYTHGGWDYRSNIDFLVGGMYPVNAGTIARECHWDRSLLGGAASASQGGRFNDNVFNATKPYRDVFVGHTATRDYKPIQLCNVWNLDSGGGWSGKLTIMDVDTKEYWQSDFVKELYPLEKGR